jgi:cytochrome bd-type quinol oxidase subunit 1
MLRKITKEIRMNREWEKYAVWSLMICTHEQILLGQSNGRQMMKGQAMQNARE